MSTKFDAETLNILATASLREKAQRDAAEAEVQRQRAEKFITTKMQPLMTKVASEGRFNVLLYIDDAVEESVVISLLKERGFNISTDFPPRQIRVSW